MRKLSFEEARLEQVTVPKRSVLIISPREE